MNKYQLYTLSGALLATTSLAGSAMAASVALFNNNAAITTSGTLHIANTSLPTTATAATTIGAAAKKGIAVVFSNSFGAAFHVATTISVSGGQFAGAGPTLSVLGRTSNEAAGTILSTIGAAAAGFQLARAPTISQLSTQIFVSSLQVTSSASVTATNTALLAGIAMTGISFNNIQALATAGGTVSLSGSVFLNNSPTTIYETLTSSAAVTSAAPLSASVTSGGNASVSASPAATPFLTLTTVGNSVILATVAITSTYTFSTDLSAILGPNTNDVGTAAGYFAGTGSASFVVSGAALQSSAATSLFSSSASGATTSTLTTAQFSSGSVSFTWANTATYSTTTTINLNYSGTTAISAAAAGSVTLTLAAGGASNQAFSGATGATGSISRGGLTSDINFASVGGSAFASYIRIHNSGTAAGTATITLRDDTTGNQVGTASYTTASIPGNGTLQVPITTIENTLGVTPNANITYTAQIVGQFVGFTQHVLYNATTGAYVDLTGFRAGGSGATP